ncbi:hypothetical protein E2C01_091436 [Portunus trituberculatus]|uniref:Uncharacterized protein n=1 Tax=Portunus trituberculatus TaxID=210409 RepID=A0A5B7JV13_PORTR|nr:hypothetical protein [Portunus trituberculatus]
MENSIPFILQTALFTSMVLVLTRFRQGLFRARVPSCPGFWRDQSGLARRNFHCDHITSRNSADPASKKGVMLMGIIKGSTDWFGEGHVHKNSVDT